MSLCYLVKLEMLIAHMIPLSCYRKKLSNLHLPQLWRSNSPDLNPCSVLLIVKVIFVIIVFFLFLLCVSTILVNKFDQ